MYSTDTETVSDALRSSSPVIFSENTISQILSLTTGTNDTNVTFAQAEADSNGNVTVAAGAELVLVASSNSEQTTIIPPASAPVVIFQGQGGVIANFNDSQSTVPRPYDGIPDRIVIGSSGNDRIVISDATSTQIILGTGDSTVMTGAGDSTVIAGLGNSTIAGGSGNTIVQLSGTADQYTVNVQNGHAVVSGLYISNSGEVVPNANAVLNDVTSYATVQATVQNDNAIVTDITGIQFVQLDNGQALVFANDTVEAAVASLYHTAFGRDADNRGLDYWFDVARSGASLNQISNGFIQSAEYISLLGGLSNSEFVNGLYNNTFDRDAEDAGLAYWVNVLETGAASRADLICSFSQIAAGSIAGTIANVETTVVGSVTIVEGII